MSKTMDQVYESFPTPTEAPDESVGLFASIFGRSASDDVGAQHNSASSVPQQPSHLRHQQPVAAEEPQVSSTQPTRNGKEAASSAAGGAGETAPIDSHAADVHVDTAQPIHSPMPAPHEGQVGAGPSVTLRAMLKSRFDGDTASMGRQRSDSIDGTEYWVHDDNVKECAECGLPFNTFRRKHHCRACGHIFCWRCCRENIPGALLNQPGTLRCCTRCAELLRQPSEASEPKRTDSVLDGSFHHQSSQAEIQTVSSSSSLHTPGSLSMSTFISFFAPDTVSVETSAQYLREAMAKGGVDISEHRDQLVTYDACFVSSHFIDWLLSQNKVTKRQQGVEIGQLLLDQRFIRHVCDPEQKFADQYQLFHVAPKLFLFDDEINQIEASNVRNSDDPQWLQQIPTAQLKPIIAVPVTPKKKPRLRHASTQLTLSAKRHPTVFGRQLSVCDDLSFGRMPTAFRPLPHMDSAPGSLDSEPSHQPEAVFSGGSKPRLTKQQSLPSPPGASLESASVTGSLPDDSVSWGTASTFASTPSSPSKPNFPTCKEDATHHAPQRIRAAAATHLRRILLQEMKRHAISPTWTSKLQTMVQHIGETVRPNTRHGRDLMNPCRYIKIVCMPGGTPEDTKLFDGFVFAKNVAHKGMHKELSNPKVMLLTFPLEYVARGQTAFTSLDTVLLQEREFLRNIVARIRRHQPDIVIVDKTVARLAQDMIREAGIDLMINIPPNALRNLARFTGATPLQNREQLTMSNILGTCKRFYLDRIYKNEDSYVTYAHFVGCPPQLGCSIMLRGAPVAELKIIKQVLKFLAYCAYSINVETSFLRDQFVDMDTMQFPAISMESTGSTVFYPVMEPEHAAPLGISGITSCKESVGDARDDTSDVFDSEQGSQQQPQMQQQQRQRQLGVKSASAHASTSNEGEDAQPDPATMAVRRAISLSSRPPSDLDDTVQESESSSSQRHSVSIVNPTATSRDHAPGPFGLEHSQSEKRHSSVSVGDLQSIRQRLRSKLQAHSGTTQSGSEIRVTVQSFMRASQNMVLSTSPSVQFQLPAAITHETVSSRMLAMNHPVIHWSDLFRPKVKRPEHAAECLDIAAHQRIDFLYSSWIDEAVTACDPPQIVSIDFYGQHDMPLGHFLESSCLDETLTCSSPTCDASVEAHIRYFVHSNAQIVVGTERLKEPIPNPHPGEPDNVFMWSWCSECGVVTPVLQMSPDTWSMSLGKYLELMLNAKSFIAAGDICPHSIRSHTRYFGKGNLTVYFEYKPITHLEILTSPRILRVPALGDTQEQWTKEMNLVTTEVQAFCQDVWTNFKELESFTREQVGTAAPKQTTVYTRMAELELLIKRYSQELEQGVVRMDATLLEAKAENLTTDTVHTVQRDTYLFAEMYPHPVEAAIAPRWHESLRQQAQALRHLMYTAAGTWNHFFEAILVDLNSSKKKWLASSKSSVVPSTEASGEAVVPPRRDSARSSSPALILASPEAYRPVSAVSSPALLPQQQHLATDSSDFLASLPSTRPPTRPGSTSSPATSTSTSRTNSKAVSPVFGGTDVEPLTPQQRAVQASEKATMDLLRTEFGAPDVSQDSRDKDKELSPAPTQSSGIMDRFKLLLSRSATTVIIQLPYSASSHYFADLPPIFDDEPTSLIAHTLATPQYAEFVQRLSAQTPRAPTTVNSPAATPAPQRKGSNGTPLLQARVSADALALIKASEATMHASNFGSQSSLATVASNDGAQAAVETSAASEAASAAKASSKQKGKKARHFELSFTHGHTNFFCQAYYAKEFQDLRAMLMGKDASDASTCEAYIRSLSRCVQWQAQGGKSGAAFSKTLDERFIMKQLSSSEASSMNDFMPKYFQHLKAANQNNESSLLVKIVGVYRIGFSNRVTKQESNQSVIVMENLFYGKKPVHVFDLKGSLRSRFAKNQSVLLDENFLEFTHKTPLYIGAQSKALLMESVQNDSTFLSSLNIMDYSMLLGIEESTGELIVGIIDFVRTFTWDKRLEMWAKKSGMLGRPGFAPTVISPDEYRERFVQAMHRYFLLVPEPWTYTSALSTLLPTQKQKLATWATRP
eukprot:m.247614 g.247614  ORF g.247614 m.247614 type:complete len:2054 (-) comp15397_c0_seq1:159-6320(-)